ncbi:hypothetical protein NM688_g5039 [Phlebia brevispora]|uniref:Uncharacterized protein n=1 Tax=Phlebia brevispora TaxID=194682 RepID=A0ACC1T1A0_9APHY|nr:hypothetical protein NM688_g5039 [Phlebia brevispora]
MGDVATNGENAAVPDTITGVLKAAWASWSDTSRIHSALKTECRKEEVRVPYSTGAAMSCSNSPMQEAVSAGLEQAQKRGFVEQQREEYEARRDILAKGLEKLGMRYTLPQGTYFLLLDISSLEWPEDYPFPESVLGRGRDFKACWFIAMEIGVSSIPVSEFYCEEHVSIGENYARFAFCKDTETLHRAVERLQGLKKFLKKN